MTVNLHRLFSSLLLLFLIIGWASGQAETSVYGYVRSNNGKAAASVSIIINNNGTKAISNDSGYYQIRAIPNKQLTLSYSCIGFQTVEKQVFLQPGERLRLDMILPQISKDIQEVSIVGEAERSATQKVNMKDFSQIPNASGNFEAIIKTLPGVSSSNELSSQYAVRGGNFDENLVYVNDVEIARPYLIRSGQQEGLSFINPDLVSSVKFYAGGFEARYGDKMSSALDVTYKRPTENQCSLSASFLGGSAALEGVTKNGKFSYIGGFRYKSSQYLLNTMDTKGEYNPAFVDIQSQLIFQPTSKLEFSLLGNFAQNKYMFVPQTQSTSFGTYSQIYNLTVYYDGQELDKYQSGMGAFTINYKPVENLSLKLITSGSSSHEQETFDIEGYYLINELDNTIGSSTYGDSLLNIGAGGMLNHARNYLWSDAWSMMHAGTWIKSNHTMRWNVMYKHEHIKDRTNEWTYIDSAGYATPYSPTSIQLTSFAEARNNLSLSQVSGYLQDTYQFYAGTTKFYLNGGLRMSYLDFSKEFLVSPRLRLSVKPAWKRDFMFFIASGIYYQTLSYKEMRDFSGIINPDIKSQRSIHIVVGSDYNLTLWNRPFKFTSELYYKLMDNLIPYKVDNLRIVYTAKNNARGYATGIDLKLNGEFVPGIESWASLSLLKTAEDQKDDYYIENGTRVYPSYYPRPTDQRITLNVFFQDYLPNNPTLQVHLNLAYGSAIPVSYPRSSRFDQTVPMGPYRRVDMGLSKTIKDDKTSSSIAFINKLKEMKLSIEVFNLLNIRNKASYLWVHTVNDQENQSNEFAVPNYLTSRRINVKLSVKF